jgi:hypothetical protein
MDVLDFLLSQRVKVPLANERVPRDTAVGPTSALQPAWRLKTDPTLSPALRSYCKV